MPLEKNSETPTLTTQRRVLPQPMLSEEENAFLRMESEDAMQSFRDQLSRRTPQGKDTKR